MRIFKSIFITLHGQSRLIRELLKPAWWLVKAHEWWYMKLADGHVTCTALDGRGEHGGDIRNGRFVRQ